MIMKNMKIFPKTFIYTITILGSISLLAHAIFYCVFPNEYLKQEKREIRERADVLVQSLNGKNISEVRTFLEAYSKNINLTAHLKRDINDGKFELTHDLDIENKGENNQLLIEERSLTTSDGYRVIVQVVLSKDVKEKFTRTLRLTLPAVVGITLFFSIVFSYFYSKILVRPLLYAADVTEKMEKLDPNARFDIVQKDEIGEVGLHINKLYETLLAVIETLKTKNKNIEKLQEQKVNFLRSASHELKTPLTSLKIMQESMLYNIGKYKNHNTYLKKSISVIDDMDKLLKEILESSKFQEWTENKEELFVKKEVENILKNYEELYLNKKLKIQNLLCEEKTILMNKQAFGKVLSNIIGNAVKYTQFYGEISIHLQNNYLVVDNTCEALEKSELDNLFKIFYRTQVFDNAKNRGTGLGIYIVKNILESYELNYSFLPYKDGMRFKIELPIK
ncbi:histidine kinase [Gemella sp. oral taxon 928]|nr:histidine kinase [Gemella sp. oral taxon 928]